MERERGVGQRRARMYQRRAALKLIELDDGQVRRQGPTDGGQKQPERDTGST